MTFADFVRRQSRGVALAETAIMISFVLLLIFTTMQFGILGYFQVAGDSATFVAAHEYTLGVTQATIAGIETKMVPSPIANAVTFVPSAPPSVDPSIFTTIYGNIDQNNRDDGYTVVRPQNFQVLLQNGIYNGILGFNGVPITAGATEGYYLMASQQMNNAGVGPNDPLAVGSSVLNPSYASPFLPNADAAIYNMNTPPYYLPSPVMMICTGPWSGSANGNSNYGEQCNSGLVTSNFLGLGEYLSNYNYGQSTMDVNYGGVFQAMAAHQRVYQKLIQAFPTIPGGTDTAAQESNLAAIQAQFQNYAAVSVTPAPCNTPACGALYTPQPSVFPNGANNLASSPTVPLYYYDNMLWWMIQGTYLKPSWNPRYMWSNEGSATMTSDNAGDGPMGPSAWGGASFALVYYWDQPNTAPHPEGPGNYPTHPLAGSQAVGDPGYQ